MGFICEHGPEAAVELAAERRAHYSDGLVLVRLPCAGRVEVVHLLRAFREGADAVFVACCLEGNCHHVYGNIEAAKRVEQAKGILEAVGLGANRLELIHIASNQPFRIPQAVAEMESRVEGLGPNPLGAKR